MKIAFDYQIFSWQRYGGISRYFCELAKNLAELEGSSIQTCVASPLYVNNYLRQAAHSLNIKGMYAPAIRHTGRLNRALNEILARAALRNWMPNLVHETYYSSNSVAPRNAKVVITVYDMTHELFSNSFSSRGSTRDEKAAAVKRADHIICISENTRRDLIRLLAVDPAKTSVVHLGYELLAAPSGTRRHEHPYILYVGSRRGYKNFDRLLQAYAASPTIHKNFHLVTFGGESLSNQEKNRINQLSQGKWQVHQIRGDDDVLADLYKFAEAFIYPSLYEGFGIPPLEAMSCGCPVLCADRSSLPEVVGNAAEIFNPESVESIAASMERVLFDSAYRQQLVELGQNRCTGFSWKKCAQQTLDVYRNVLNMDTPH